MAKNIRKKVAKNIQKEKWPRMFCSGPEKRHIPHKVVDSGNGVFRIEFTTVEVSLFLFSQSSDLPFNKFEEPCLHIFLQVGSYVIDVTVSSLSVPRFHRIYLILAIK